MRFEQSADIPQEIGAQIDDLQRAEVSDRILGQFNAFLKERTEQGLPLVITASVARREAQDRLAQRNDM